NEPYSRRIFKSDSDLTLYSFDGSGTSSRTRAVGLKSNFTKYPPDVMDFSAGQRYLTPPQRLASSAEPNRELATLALTRGSACSQLLRGSRVTDRANCAKAAVCKSFIAEAAGDLFGGRHENDEPWPYKWRAIRAVRSA